MALTMPYCAVAGTKFCAPAVVCCLNGKAGVLLAPEGPHHLNSAVLPVDMSSSAGLPNQFGDFQ